MATVKVYNRDGTEYGTLDTNQYLFNNSLIGFEPIKLNPDIYPYVKVNGIYYVNDGSEFYSRGRADNSAGLMNLATTYLDNGNSPLSSSKIYIGEEIPELEDFTMFTYSIQGSPSIAKKFSLRDYQIKGEHITGLTFVKSQVNQKENVYKHMDDFK